MKLTRLSQRGTRDGTKSFALGLRDSSKIKLHHTAIISEITRRFSIGPR